MIEPLAREMGDAYPELRTSQAHVERLVKLEEERFAETLEHGMRLLDEAIAHLNGTQIGGETVFKLYDTYGFPVDLTADIARERGLTLDLVGFEQAMAQQKPVRGRRVILARVRRTRFRFRVKPISAVMSG